MHPGGGQTPPPELENRMVRILLEPLLICHTLDSNQKQNEAPRDNIFSDLCASVWVRIQTAMNLCSINLTSKKLALNGPVVIHS